MGASSSAAASKRAAVQDDAPFQGLTPPAAVPTAPRYPTRYVDVLGKRMAYVEVAAPLPSEDAGHTARSWLRSRCDLTAPSTRSLDSLRVPPRTRNRPARRRSGRALNRVHRLREGRVGGRRHI